MRSDGEESFVTLMWKSKSGTVTPYSMSARKMQDKIPWGAVDKVEHGTEIKAGESVGFLRFYKKSEDKKFFLNEMNSMPSGANEFAQSIQSLVVGRDFKLLASYLNLLMKSSGFTGHHAAIHSELGLRVDKTGIQELELERDGGSLQGLKDFINSGKISRDAVVVQSAPAPKKRKNGDIRMFGEVTKKVKDKETVLDKQMAEIDDSTGPEKEYKNSFVGE